MGRFLLPRLLARHAHVRAVSRTPPSVDATPQLQWCKGDLYDPALSVPSGADVIVSLGPLDVFSLWLERQPAAGHLRAQPSVGVPADGDCGDELDEFGGGRGVGPPSRLEWN